MNTPYIVDLQILDNSFKKLESFIKKFASAFSDILKSGFLSTTEVKLNKKKANILTFQWRNIDEILLDILRRFGRFTYNNTYVMKIYRIEKYGKLDEEEITLDKENKT